MKNKKTINMLLTIALSLCAVIPVSYGIIVLMWDVISWMSGKPIPFGNAELPWVAFAFSLAMCGIIVAKIILITIPAILKSKDKLQIIATIITDFFILAASGVLLYSSIYLAKCHHTNYTMYIFLLIGCPVMPISIIFNKQFIKLLIKKPAEVKKETI